MLGVNPFCIYSNLENANMYTSRLDCQIIRLFHANGKLAQLGKINHKHHSLLLICRIRNDEDLSGSCRSGGSPC